MADKQGLSARQLLEGVYNLLKEKPDGREIKLPLKALAEIANDSDWHRIRVGYTGYETATLLEVDGKEWAVAFGVKCGRYPANPYNCDIAAIPVSTNGKSDEEMANEIYEVLESGSYFHNSLVYAMADGQLAVNKNGRFGQKVLKLLRPRVQEFVAQSLIDSRWFTLDIRPVENPAVQYKPEFVIFLFDAFRVVLAS